jgi:hypothetical protein
MEIQLGHATEEQRWIHGGESEGEDAGLQKGCLVV